MKTRLMKEVRTEEMPANKSADYEMPADESLDNVLCCTDARCRKHYGK